MASLQLTGFGKSLASMQFESFNRSLAKLTAKTESMQGEAKKRSWRRPSALGLLLIWPWLSAARGTTIKWVASPFSLCLAPVLSHIVLAAVAGLLLVLRCGKEEAGAVFSFASAKAVLCHVPQGIAAGLKNAAYAAASPAVVNSLLRTSVVLGMAMALCRDWKSVKQTQALAVLGTLLAVAVLALCESEGSARAAGGSIVAMTLGAAALETGSAELWSLVQGEADELEAPQLRSAVSSCLGTALGCVMVLPAIDYQHVVEHGLFSGLSQWMVLLVVLAHALSTSVMCALTWMVGPTLTAAVGSADILAAYTLVAAVAQRTPPNASQDTLLLGAVVVCAMVCYIYVLDMNAAVLEAQDKTLASVKESQQEAHSLPNLLTTMRNSLIGLPGQRSSHAKQVQESQTLAASGTCLGMGCDLRKAAVGSVRQPDTAQDNTA